MPKQKKRWMCYGVAAVAIGLLLAGLVGPAPVQAAPAGSGYIAGTPTRVAVNGLGDALIWPLFTVDNTNTLLAITNTSIHLIGTDTVAGCSGCMGTDSISMGPNSIGQFTLVRFHIRRDTDSVDIRDFSVCLSPGDVWTMTLSRVGSATKLVSTDTSCIDFEQSKPTCNSGLDEPLTGNPLRGYIEAVAIDTGTRGPGDANPFGCDGVAGGIDTQPGGAPWPFVRSLFGETFYVNLSTGIANGANATALVNLQELHASDNAVTDSIRTTICPTGTCSSYNSNQKRAFFALTHPGEFATVGSLVSRWILDTAAGFDTQMVVTFPLGNLSLSPTTDLDDSGQYVGSSSNVSFNFNIPSQMALYLRNDSEARSHSPRQVVMGKEVNVITLSTEVAANPTLLPTASSKAGWLHFLIDDDENEFVDAVAGAACTSTNSGSGACLPGSLTNLFMPRMLPIVGFSILNSTITGKFSALLPWKWMPPADDYSCGGDSAIIGDIGRCRGRGLQDEP